MIRVSCYNMPSHADSYAGSWHVICEKENMADAVDKFVALWSYELGKDKPDYAFVPQDSMLKVYSGIGVLTLYVEPIVEGELFQ